MTIDIQRAGQKGEQDGMEEKNRTGEQLSAELGMGRAKAVIGKVVTVIGGVLLIGSVLTGQLPLALLGLVVAMIGGYTLSKHNESIKKTLSEEVVNGVLAEVFGEVEYNPFGHIPDTAIEGAHMLFPISFERVRGSDYVKAMYKGMPLELSDVELYHVDSVYNEERNEWEDRENLAFQGQWLICGGSRKLSGEVHLAPCTGKSRRQFKKERILTGNEAFDERFIVTAQYEQEAFYILTPHMMEYILDVQQKSGGDLYMSFLQDEKMHIAVKSGRNFFELGRSRAETSALRGKFLGEIRWFTDMFDALHLLS